MNPTVRVVLLGFTPFERAHIEAALQPGDEPGHHYCVAESLAASSLAVVNADDDMAVAQVLDQGRLQSAVMLGTTTRTGAAAQLPRPISLVQLLRVLDQLVHSAPPMSAAVQRVQDDWARMLSRATPATRIPAPPTLAAGSATAAMPLIQGRSSRLAATSKATSTTAPSTLPPAIDSNGMHALVVDSSDEVWRFMSQHMPALGYAAHRVMDCAQALERINQCQPALVFLASGLDGLDSFHTCKTIKRGSAPGDQGVPRVVMLLGRGAAVDAVRADMAGADACLHHPLRAEHLTQVLNLVAPDNSQAWPRTQANATSAISAMD